MSIKPKKYRGKTPYRIFGRLAVCRVQPVCQALVLLQQLSIAALQRGAHIV